MSLDVGAMITLSTNELVERGVPIDLVATQRMQLTGHRRPLSQTWLRAVGCWGGVRTLDEIARRTDNERTAVRDYAKGMHLRSASRNLQRTQPELAVMLWCDRGRPALESCRLHGVLPIERVLYCNALQFLMDDTGIDISVALSWSIAELRERWSSLELDIEQWIER